MARYEREHEDCDSRSPTRVSSGCDSPPSISLDVVPVAVKETFCPRDGDAGLTAIFVNVCNRVCR